MRDPFDDSAAEPDRTLHRRTPWRFLGLWCLTAVIPPQVFAQAELLGTTAACDSPGSDPWINQLRDRVVSGDQLARSAMDRYGSPATCTGAVTAEFDGARFGWVTLGFAEGVTLRVETMPPEVSVVTLWAPAGFEDEDSVRPWLEAYSASRGLQIDWSSPTVTMEGEYRARSFWDPDVGLNGSASLIFREETLVGLRVSMAP